MVSLSCKEAPFVLLCGKAALFLGLKDSIIATSPEQHLLKVRMENKLDLLTTIRQEYEHGDKKFIENDCIVEFKVSCQVWSFGCLISWLGHYLKPGRSVRGRVALLVKSGTRGDL